jgi:hypothetical protein
MSGGYFDYKEWHIDQIANDLEVYINKCDRKEEKNWGHDDESGKYIPAVYDESEEVLNEFRNGLKILRQAFVYAKRIDYLLSGDDGDESFLRFLKQELEALNDR